MPTPAKSNGKGNGKSFSSATVKSKSNGKQQHTYKAKSNGKAATGKLSEYKPDKHPEAAYQLTARLGAEEKDIAIAFGVSTVTIHNWKKEHEDFLNAIKRGKLDWDSQNVVSALRKRALGYEYTETTEKHLTIKRGRGDKAISMPAIEETIAKKQLAPDVTACIFWLVNRQPEMWKHVARTIIQGDPKNPVKYDHSGKVEHTVEDMGIVNDPARAAEVARILKASGAFDAIAGGDTAPTAH